ncbi:MAG TPA: N-acetyl-gamma-glutamyl-phosphate reductase [Bacilli bacterium]
MAAANTKLRIGIVGSTGYGGVELIRLLLEHPNVRITSVVSASHAGSPMSEWFPHLTDIITETLDPVDVDMLKAKTDVVFAATPSGVSSELCPRLLDAGLKVIDLSGDFRLRSQEAYETWYKRKAADKKYLQRAVYGLAEVYGTNVRGADFVSNPGCYSSTALLGLIPAVKAGWLDDETLIIDAKSGVSGAGRGLKLSAHYSEVNENLSAYKLNKHQHIPEIEQVLSDVAERNIVTTFTTHLVPMTRGIMCTMYAKVKGDRSDQDFIDLYRQFYEGRPFVRIRPQGVWPATKEVSGSNYCDIGFAVDHRTNRVTIVSVTDNLVKGAAGQAVQNLNLMMGWDEATGLRKPALYP